jgi:hypothetical protein
LSRKIEIKITAWFDDNIIGPVKEKELEKTISKAISKKMFGDKLLGWDIQALEIWQWE